MSANHSEFSQIDSCELAIIRVNPNKGQTLVESLLAIAVAILVVTALVGVGISSMRAASFGKNQAEAVRLASQTLEVLQSLRDASWPGFVSILQASNCDSANGCCVYYTTSYQLAARPSAYCLVNSIDTKFSYSNLVSTVGQESVDITSTAAFYEGSTLRIVTLNRTYYKW